MTIHDRTTPWLIAITAVLAALLMCWQRATIGFVIAIAACELVVILCLLTGAYTVTLTREGITCKNLFRPMTATWADITSVSVLHFAQGWYISITRKDGFDVLIPYSDRLKTAILACRGFLEGDGKP